jgi:hypothetical protein
MTTELATRDPEGASALLEQVLVGGDLEKLSPTQRLSFYRQVCDSLNLNPLTQPLLYVRLNNKLTLYAKKDATDQLRRLHHVSVQIVSAQAEGDLYVVRARATTPDGRTDEEIGVVGTAGLKGEALANAYMKAHTKAKRRVTLSLCGLGLLDDAEVDSVPGAERVDVDRETGELLPGPAGEQGQGHSEPPRNGNRRREALEHVAALLLEADGLGVAYEPLPDGATLDDIRSYYRRVGAAVQRARVAS